MTKAEARKLKGDGWDIADAVLADVYPGWPHIQTHGILRGAIAAVVTAERERAAAAAWDAATERAAKVAIAAAERNESCPAGCRCADGYHIAARIREGT